MLCVVFSLCYVQHLVQLARRCAARRPLRSRRCKITCPYSLKISTGDRYVERHSCSEGVVGKEPLAWNNELRPEDWRRILLECANQGPQEMLPEQEDFFKELERATVASFADGVNTGFYINSYTTKQCPSLTGVLEEMRKGLERMQQSRDARTESSKDEKANQTTIKTRSKFGETLDVLKRLSASYRRCYWKSGSELLFPIFFGHMTFASHRCWKVFVKKGVFLAAEAWRKEYGKAVRHSALRDGGGEVLQFLRAGMDAYPLPGWKRIQNLDGDYVYQGINGEVFGDLQEVYEYTVAARAADSGIENSSHTLTFLQKFLRECASESEQREEDGQRYVLTTSTLEDWLFRGDHPILAAMSLTVYCMWVFRIDRPPRRSDKPTKPRFIDIDFSPSYSLYITHAQRIATEVRVPMFEGFLMPSRNVDAETAAMYKQLLLRPFAVESSRDPVDLQVIRAFGVLSEKARNGATAFSENWQKHASLQLDAALEGRRRFLDRYEWPSLWETAEVQLALRCMYQETCDDDGDDDGQEMAQTVELDPPHCPDRAKLRASVAQYTAIVGEDVAENLEGIAMARLDLIASFRTFSAQHPLHHLLLLRFGFAI